MHSYAFTFPSGTTAYHFEAMIEDLHELAPPATSIVITDDTIAALHADKLEGYRMLTIPPGEGSKTGTTIEQLSAQLLELGAHRGTLLIGLGGGVVTDLTGFLASVYMRGIAFAFVPTTLLGMVDAAIGGKNGVNVGVHKNMLGTIRQPQFILFHTEFLLTLPAEQWSNGFAEIIKYGYIADARILTTLSQADVVYFQKHPYQMGELIAGCVDIKNKIIHADEYETGLRKTLNFGHTAGHAFEMLGNLPHGYAVGLGMMVAMRLSGQHKGLADTAKEQLGELLTRYGLPAEIPFDPQQTIEIMRMDKKQKDGHIDYVLIEKPGVAVIHPLTPEEIMPHL